MARDRISWRTGLRYRWWRRIHWDYLATALCCGLLAVMLILVLGAWWLDFKPSDLP